MYLAGCTFTYYAALWFNFNLRVFLYASLKLLTITITMGTDVLLNLHFYSKKMFSFECITLTNVTIYSKEPQTCSLYRSEQNFRISMKYIERGTGSTLSPLA